MSRKKGLLLLVVSIVVLIMAIVLGIMFGNTVISPLDIFSVMFDNKQDISLYRILTYIRIPRVCAALLAGSALAVSGLLLQAVLNNPLACPNIIGVNNGAGLMVLICSIFFPNRYDILPFAAFIGALATAILVFSLAMGKYASKIVLVLTGIAISSILGAGMNTILIVAPDVYTGASVFLVGGLLGVTQQELLYPTIYIIVGLIMAICISRHLNVLSLGDSTAQTLGMNVTRVRFLTVLAAAILTGAAISFAGLIGFVGLIIPHMIRFFGVTDHCYLIPISTLIGGAFVILCDLVARVLFAPYELPVGILMAFMGGPFFIILVLKSRRKQND